MKKIGTLILLFSVFGIFSAQKNDGLKISQSKSQYSINDTIPKIIYPQRWENNKTLVLLNEQPTSLASLTTINPEHIETAYKLVQEYCEKNKLDVVEFVTNKSNVEPASEYIHKQLPFAVRLVLKPKKMAKMIEDNHNFIVAKAKEYSENKKA